MVKQVKYKVFAYITNHRRKSIDKTRLVIKRRFQVIDLEVV
jgi:hypothetical protein